MEKKIVNSIEEMKDFAVFYIKNLSKERNTVQVVELIGDLGSGKTTFTQQVAKFFEIEDYITSPTFVIQKKYKIKTPQGFVFENLIHIDAYRLSSGKELLDLGWEENFSNPKNIIFIEWPEKVAKVLPQNTKKINFKFNNKDKREVSYD